jgi:glutamate dehydrogenase (NADP+)
MEKMNVYATEVLNKLEARVPWEKQFLQAVKELFHSISPVLDQEPQYQAERILERITVPDRVVSFKVPWVNDKNEIQVHNGYRVQFNNALGPYKGGLRFHASVDLDSMKFLAFEQMFKNALTGLPLGGGKGGADLPTRGLSDRESMRFCQSFMQKLHEYIGPDMDVPAGDIGVGKREIGYLFGQYKSLTHEFNGVITGKTVGWGGSRLRPEATGFGIVYFTENILNANHDSIKGKTVAISGFGQVAWGVAKKIIELGGKVVTLSGPDGYVYDANGLDDEKNEYMLELRYSGKDQIRPYAERFKAEFHEGKRPWEVPCDVAIPCAIQNELDESDAASLLKNKCKCVVEGANMPSTLEAISLFRNAKILFAPGKAANAGGVAVSGLEMSQNRLGLYWTAEKVDETLKQIMSDIHKSCLNAAEMYNHSGDYVAGANIAGFVNVANAMIDQGVV